MKENLVLLTCPFRLNIRLNNCSEVLENTYILEHFARDIGTVKWHPYNAKAKVILLVQ